MTTKPMAVRKRGLDGEPAWRIGVRCVTALPGAYFAAAGLSSLFARLAPLPRVEATTWGLILSFALFAGLALWAFAEPRLIRMAGVIWSLAALSTLAGLALGGRP
jgi:hypothetical protein